LLLRKSLVIAGLTVAVAAGFMANGNIYAAETPPRIGTKILTFQLENGLQVVVIPDHRAPVVTHMIWYKVGAADEPPGRSGIAHYLEHLMFKGTKTHPAGEFSKVIASLGGQENAFTSPDYTGYYQRIHKKHLQKMMEFEADRMANLVLTEEVARPELAVILEERATRIDNRPGGQLSQALYATLYQQHPYGIPIIGWKHEIEKLTYTDAVEFYDRFYTPNNAILVVAGDVEAEGVRELAEKTYGKIARRAEPRRGARPAEPRVLAARRVDLRHRNVQQPSMRKVWVVPSYSTAKPGEAESLDLLGDILGSGTNSHLYRELVVKRQLATSAQAWFQGSGLDDSSFMVVASPRPGVTLEALEKAVLEVIETLKSDGVSERDLKRIKNGLIADTIYSQDSQARLARIYGAALSVGKTVQDVQSWPDKIARVNPGQIQQVARKYLVPQDAVTGTLRPAQADK
jgi:zinc protease